jgi:hypothetical protein
VDRYRQPDAEEAPGFRRRGADLIHKYNARPRPALHNSAHRKPWLAQPSACCFQLAYFGKVTVDNGQKGYL